MQNPASKFASWSLVTAALILAAGIIGGAVVLQRPSKALAATPPPVQSKPADAMWITDAELLDTVIRWTELGWIMREAGLTLTESTNRASLTATGQPVPPINIERIAQRNAGKKVHGSVFHSLPRHHPASPPGKE